jgi:RNA polymerase sigma-70 factor (ECF subfamily)
VVSLTADESGVGVERGVAPAREEPRVRLSRALTDHYDFVWRSLRRLGVPEADAEDVAQEVFMTLSHRLSDVVAGCERAFLYRTAVNHAAHVHRSRARRREVSEPALDEAPSSARTPEDLLAGARARALCHELLDELSLEQRAVFVLYELEEMTMNEIAEMLELPMGTVASRLRRGRDAFEKRLRQRLAVAGGQ